jgi:microcystin-dependent protein
MASTYSDRLRIELIAAGDQSGTWGDTTNANLGTLIEESIAGMAEVSMSDSDYTLTANNGVTDEARQMILKVTGTITATRQVIVPQKEKLYVVHNLTSSGQKIHVKTSAATGVEVSYGFKALVYCNGTDVISVMPQALNETATANDVLTYNGTAWVASSIGGLAFSSGMIINWAGNIASPPSGWLVCDGTSKLVADYGDLHTAIGYAFGGSGGNFNVPDMRDKFVIGAGSTYSVADTGGSADSIVVSHNHTFSGNTSNVGNHSHNWANNEANAKFAGVSDVVNPSGFASGNRFLSSASTRGAGAHGHSFNGTTATSGSSGTGANLPPYVALGFIIKT